MTGQCASYFHRTGRFLPSACPKIAAAPAEKNEQHDDQNNQRSIVHELSLSLIKRNRVSSPPAPVLGRVRSLRQASVAQFFHGFLDLIDGLIGDLLDLAEF
jgi:hypothetical protein